MQLNHFTRLFRRNAAATSIEAAESVLDGLKELQQRVYQFAKSRPNGFTDDEMNEHFQTFRSTYRARRAELMHKGLIVDSGKRRKGDNGRNSTVWILPEFIKQ